MTVEGYLKRLENRGIKAEQIPQLSDRELLKVRGVGKTGVNKLREKFGSAEKPETLQLAKQVELALLPVLTERRGVGASTVRAMARMVAAYFA